MKKYKVINNFHDMEREKCTCIGETNRVYIVEYNIDGTNNKKVGYVKYYG